GQMAPSCGSSALQPSHINSTLLILSSKIVGRLEQPIAHIRLFGCSNLPNVSNYIFLSEISSSIGRDHPNLYLRRCRCVFQFCILVAKIELVGVGVGLSLTEQLPPPIHTHVSHLELPIRSILGGIELEVDRSETMLAGDV